MLSTENYPKKKLSRIKNPFQSSQAMDSICSEQKVSSHDSPKHYDRERMSNVFQFNDRSRVMLTDSQLGSEINNNNQSGESIYNFSRCNNKQSVQEIPQKFTQSIQTPTFPFNTNRQQKKVQKSSILSHKNKHVINPTDNNNRNQQHQNQYPQTRSQTNTMTISYQPSEVTMYKFSEKLSNQQLNFQQKSQETLIQLKAKSFISKPQTIIAKQQKQPKKTFKPTLFNQLQSCSEDQDNIINSNLSKTSSNNNINQPTTSQKIDQGFSFQIQYQKLQNSRKSVIPKTSSRVKQQIQNQNIDIFISPSQHHPSLTKDKQKAKILEDNKLHLSCGSSVHSYTDNILDDMRDKLGPPIQRVQVPFESRNNSMQREINEAKHIVQSKVIHEDASQYGGAQSFKPNMTKKPRKKIFEPRTDKTTYQHSTNFTRTPRSHYSPYVSQFQRQNHEVRDFSPSQMLMKSLNIIDKLAAQKSTHARNESRVVVVPPAPLTITQSHPNGFSVYSLSPEQIGLRKQILDLNFQVSMVQTSFDLEKFDTRELITKVKFLDEASIRLFEKYKALFLAEQMMSIQNSSNNALRQEILHLRESTTKLVNFQQKYIQINHILSSLEEQIKDILLLNSKEKYKKIKLLNEAIQVMEKTETYLSLQISKIPIFIKIYVKKQKILLQQLRDWLKQCISKQNSL